MKYHAGALLLMVSLLWMLKAQDNKLVVNFELWNKHDSPIYYNVGTSLEQALQNPLVLVRPGTRAVQTINTSNPTYLGLAIGHQPRAQERLDVYQIKPHKNIYVRVGLLPEGGPKDIVKKILGHRAIVKDDSIFGPQTGPLFGFREITETGHPLANNVTREDITPLSGTYTYSGSTVSPTANGNGYAPAEQRQGLLKLGTPFDLAQQLQRYKMQRTTTPVLPSR